MGRVLAVGVFDVFQRGHLTYLQSCAALGDELIVLVARDVDITPSPIVVEDSRVLLVDSVRPVDAAVLQPAGHIAPVLREIDPAVIAIEDVHASHHDHLCSRLAACGFPDVRVESVTAEHAQAANPVHRASEAGVIRSIFTLDE